jgi:Ca2+-binding EF-hand superfamily protein
MFFNYLGFMFSCVKVENKEFDKIDLDHDGRISLNEFHSYYINTHGQPPTNDQWFKFHLADKNNNGYISKYDIEMFQTTNKLFV